MVGLIDEIWMAVQPTTGKVDDSSRQMRRSLYVVHDMVEGERFTDENVRSIRPAYGMAPGMLEWLLDGKKSSRALKRGTPLSLKLIKAGH